MELRAGIELIYLRQLRGGILMGELCCFCHVLVADDLGAERYTGMRDDGICKV